MRLFDLDLSRPEVFLPLAIGIVSALTAFTVSSWLILRRKKAGPPRPPEEKQHDPFAEGSVSERRVSARRRGNAVEIDVRIGEEDVCADGWVVNRSTGGLCFRLGRAFEVGAVLRVRARHAPQITPWTDVEVCSCRKQGDEWEIGCRFVRTPPWSILLLFG